MSRRKFNKEFKVAAAKLVLDDALPVSQVAQQLWSSCILVCSYLRLRPWKRNRPKRWYIDLGIDDGCVNRPVAENVRYLLERRTALLHIGCCRVAQ